MEELNTLRAILRNSEDYPPAKSARTSREPPNDEHGRMELPPSSFVLQVLGTLKGYHREERILHLPPVEAQRARRLFWSIFMFDKNLSLRLGRAPTIQDYDVDVKQCGPSQDPSDLPWDQVFAALIELSRLQAQIYQLLYSPSSNALDTKNRQAMIEDLKANLSDWYDGWKQIDTSNAHCKEILSSVLGPSEVTYYSVLTILHRSANLSNSVQDIVPDCFEAARQGLHAHLARWPHTISAGMPVTSLYGVW
ncbi:unnamed protein product [Clonostachys rosea]|uniref:Xylanolytic transcriptional activator regulatory domain-containing protein n=1 Tax=Bionectria ochroleuca TaxID=29856 RepID=A0ABY6U3S0_BIOOC|nr:unnamed protein product [Clonostachys rosea]